jgi:putative CRISPR-associated protein (TIGR02619 family)
MPNFILTTCGTSLFTNGISNELRGDFFQYTNQKTWEDIPVDIALRLQQHAQQQETKLLASEAVSVRRMSAELNSLLAWYDKNTADVQDVHLLLATDTILGTATAEIIKKWLQNQGYIVFIISASGLNTASFQSFRESLSDLTANLVEQISGYKANGYQILFNLTGGFKALNGFLQALSTIYADQTIYLFESSTEFLTIPKLPFKLDAESIITENMRSFRRLSAGLVISQQECLLIPSTLLFYIDDEVTLSEWGTLLWQSCHKGLYKTKLWPSISERIIFSADFEKSTKDLDSQVLQIVNQRITDLAVYAEGDCQDALRSLDPKLLQEKQYKDKNIWECDLDPHHRIFMVKDGFTFCLQEVGKSLH